MLYYTHCYKYNAVEPCFARN